jgi:hypothetical protein
MSGVVLYWFGFYGDLIEISFLPTVAAVALLSLCNSVSLVF